MKKTIIALFALASVSMMVQAKTITLDGTAYDGPSWAYVWDNKGTQWGHLEGITETSLTYSDYTPTGSDPIYVGYTFSSENGKQTLTSMNEVMTVNAPAWIGSKGAHLGGQVTLVGTNNGLSANSFIDFADIATSQLAYTGDFWKQGDVSVTGALTLSGDSFEHIFFSASSMHQKAGAWDFSDFSVTDADGNALTYAADEANIGKAGYFWVEETDFTPGSEYSAKLVAKAVPEPATATLSLLALAGLAARRRRK